MKLYIEAVYIMCMPLLCVWLYFEKRCFAQMRFVGMACIVYNGVSEVNTDDILDDSCGYVGFKYLHS
ncbi:hypothetical protein [Butyrivibrio proteoclasticus]|uniref:hypothetical protein n=1 Tax=Butyrivibrio proteoclasticus TaxID=43305 RepID=UPI001160C62E|nr:hypothetical protein [Butyrivibrio proteoclasticus]